MRPLSSRCTSRQRVSANGPDRMRTFWPISRSESRRTVPELSVAATSASTMPCGTGIGCWTPMISEATPKVLLTQRHWSLERSRIKENIAGKQRRQNAAQFASVPDGAPQSRSETPEAQAMEVELCGAFAMGVHARDKPTLPPLQIESPRKRFDWSDRILATETECSTSLSPIKSSSLRSVAATSKRQTL